MISQLLTLKKSQYVGELLETKDESIFSNAITPVTIV